MKSIFLLVLGLAVCAPARAQSVPAERIEAFLGGAPEFNGAALTRLDSIPTPPSVPAGSIVSPALWSTLPAPDASTLTRLAARIPGLNVGTLRVLTNDAAEALLASAAAKAETPLEFFTDPAFRGGAAFYLDQATVAALFSRYDIRGLTPQSGRTKDGASYAVQGIVVGGGRIEILYDLDQFTINNPALPGYRYTLAGRVTERIQGPGDLTVEGVSVHWGLLTPKIERITELSSARARVKTNYGSLNEPVYPIRRR
ncbi:MAG: hypothetical protein ACHQ49_00920 [Elusimicrobiota bacterium]